MAATKRRWRSSGQMKRVGLRSYLRCLAAGLSSVAASAFLRRLLDDEEGVAAGVFAAATPLLLLVSLPGVRAGFIAGDVDVSVRASSLLSSTEGGLWMASCVRLGGGGAASCVIQLWASPVQTLGRRDAAGGWGARARVTAGRLRLPNLRQRKSVARAIRGDACQCWQLGAARLVCGLHGGLAKGSRPIAHASVGNLGGKKYPL
jgi:hypothetical protein